MVSVATVREKTALVPRPTIKRIKSLFSNHLAQILREKKALEKWTLQWLCCVPHPPQWIVLAKVLIVIAVQTEANRSLSRRTHNLELNAGEIMEKEGREIKVNGKTLCLFQLRLGILSIPAIKYGMCLLRSKPH